MRRWWRRRTARRAALRREVRDELRFHVEGEVDRLVGRGLSEDEARQRVRAQLGDAVVVEARMHRLSSQRERRRGRRRLFTATRRDCLAALRAVRSRPLLSAVSIAMLTLGIGATTTIWSVAYGVLWRPLPYEAPDALYVIGDTWPRSEITAPVAPPVFFDWQAQTRSFERLAGVYRQPLDYEHAREPLRLQGVGASAQLARLLGVAPALGRWFTAGEDAPGAPPVAVISHALWSNLWNSDPAALGAQLKLDGRAFTLIGVMPEEFRGPEALGLGAVDVWFPLTFIREDLDSHANAFIRVLARLASGVSPEAAAAEMASLTDDLVATYPAGRYQDGIDFRMTSLAAMTVGDASSSLSLLAGAVTALLLIACVNAVHLGLAAASSRGPELSVRLALGASRVDLARQLLMEALAVAVAAGALAVLLANLGIRAVAALGPAELPRLAEVALRPAVLGPALMLTLVSALFVGLMPAFRAARGGARAGRTRGGDTSRDGRVRGLLVTLEVAFAVTLLVGAGVLANSFLRLRSVDPGFDPEGVTVMHLSLGDRYPDRESRVALLTAVLEQVRALPGIEAAALANGVPFGGGGAGGSFVLESPPESDLPAFVGWQLISDGFVETLGARMVAGSELTAPDLVAGSGIVLINQAFARIAWPQGDAVGKRLKIIRTSDQAPWRTVVGVVADTKQTSLSRETAPEVYVPYVDAPVVFPRADILARADRRAAIGALLRDALWQVDPLQPVGWVEPLSSRVRASLAEQRFFLWFVGTFAALSIALACGGVYAAQSYAIGRRTREMGIRLAVGATPRRLVHSVVGQGMTPVAIGAALGVVGALAASGLLSGYVYGIRATDPATLVVVVVVVLGVAALAAWVPARRAARVDPVSALRAS